MNADKVFSYVMTSEKGGPLEYTGTLPLDLEEFPNVINDQGGYSNIITGQYTLDGGKVVLFPTMRKGKKLTEEEIRAMISEGLHFGIYNSREEADWIDNQIHKNFKKQTESQSVLNLYGK